MAFFLQSARIFFNILKKYKKEHKYLIKVP